MKQNRRTWLLTIPLLLVLTFWLLHTIWITQMYSDESLVYHFTRFDLAYAINYQAYQDVHPPLWFSLFWGWRQLVGDSEFIGRFLSLLFSLITLSVTYRIGRDWFGKARVGLFAMAILGASAYFMEYALEIRPYALVMLLATISMWVFARWLKRGTRRWAISYGVITAIMFYVHYFLVFLVAAQMIYFLFSRPSRRLIIQGVGAAVLAVLLWLPWFPLFLHQVGVLHRLAQEAGNSYGLGVGTPATTQATNLTTIIKLIDLATNGQPLVFGLVLLIGMVFLWRKTYYRLVLLWALGVPAISLALNTVAAVYTDRYISYLLIGLALALGAAVAIIERAVLRNLALVGFVAVNLWAMPAWFPVRIPYRDVYHEVSSLAQTGDVVLNTPADRSDQFLEWQQTHYLSATLQPGITTELDQAQGARRVWFMTSDWFNPSVQAQFHQLEPTHPVQEVIGQCPERGWCYLAQLMEAPPLSAPQRFGDSLDFWGVDVDSVTPQTVKTRLWWRVQQTPTLDYSISLRLSDDAGTLVAQKDGPINHYGAQIFQTSQLEPNKIYVDWRTLDLPPGLAHGTYHLGLVVYQSWDNTRLLLPDGSDSLALESLTVN